MRWITAAVAIGAFAALAWGALPEFPATYQVRETTQLGMVVSVAGRTRGMSRRARANGVLAIGADQTLHFSTPQGFLVDSDATWTPDGRGALRFTLTDGAKEGIEVLLEDTLGGVGLDGTARGRFSRGRLSFAEQGSRVAGHQVTRMTLKGHLGRRRVNVWITARMAWRGARTP